MEKELAKSNKKITRKVKPLVSVAALLVIMVFTGFAYDYFSGIRGDDLVIKSEYKGNGIVHIEVENKSHKKLHFTKGVLKSWYDNQELVYLNEKGEKDLPCVKVDMPLIKGGAKKTLVIDLSSCDYKKLEKPIKYNDGFVFVLTNDNFQFGQNWTASIRFNNKIVKPTPATTRFIKERVDNTNLDYIKEIKDNYKIVAPLKKMIVTLRYNSKMKYHPRVCLASDTGTKIYAVTDGTVIRPEPSRYIGLYVIVEHSGGFLTEYTNCSKILVENGQYVKAGDVIAEVGTTGRSTGPHLGFSAKYKGENINPLLLYPKNILHGLEDNSDSVDKER